MVNATESAPRYLTTTIRMRAGSGRKKIQYDQLPFAGWFLKAVFRYYIVWASLVARTVKNLPAMQETQIQSLGRGGPLERGKATHFSILAWRIPWREEPAGLQFRGSQSQR